MDELILYSTGCPRCMVLEKKLDEKNIPYRRVEDVDEMLSLGIMEVPVLKLGEELLRFADAVQWVNNQ